MGTDQNIKAIIECVFSEAKEELQDVAVKKIMDVVGVEEKKDRLDEVIAIVAYILDCLRSYKNIVESGDCNNCVYTHCEYKPSVGQMVRYNCPFYDGGKHDLYQ